MKIHSLNHHWQSSYHVLEVYLEVGIRGPWRAHGLLGETDIEISNCDIIPENSKQSDWWKTEWLTHILSLASADSLSRHCPLTICSQKWDIFAVRVSSKSGLPQRCRNASKFSLIISPSSKVIPPLLPSQDKQKHPFHTIWAKSRLPQACCPLTQKLLYTSPSAPFISLYLKNRWGYLQSCTPHCLQGESNEENAQRVSNSLSHHTRIILRQANCQLQYTQFPEERTIVISKKALYV